MPLYAYRCRDCGIDFDARMPIADRDEVSCPACGHRASRMLAMISAIGSQGEPEPGCGPGMCAARQAAGMPCSMA